MINTDAPTPPVWRVGPTLGRTLYRDGVCVGMVDTPALAAEIVAALNGTPLATSPLVNSPAVWIDPARRSGGPCLAGHSVNIEYVADLVWMEGVDSAVDYWDSNRPAVLVACWAWAAYFAHAGEWAGRWERWRLDAHRFLWHRKYDDCPDPPMRPEAQP